jgi:hypothetical protein
MIAQGGYLVEIMAQLAEKYGFNTGKPIGERIKMCQNDCKYPIH